MPIVSPLPEHLAKVLHPNADLLGVEKLLEADEYERLQALHEHLQTKVRPVVGEYWDREEFCFDLLPGLAEQGLGRLGDLGVSRLYRGLAYAEVTRADVSLSALVGIHNELVVDLIGMVGSKEQQDKWLPGLHDFTKIGCFALTEPDHGSDIAGGLATTAIKVDDGWVLEGRKRWIGGGTFCDFAIVFARDVADGVVKGFIVESDREGWSATKISRKMGLRIMQNADITLDKVHIPDENLLPRAASFADTNIALRNSRAWVGWQGAGVQLAILDAARSYVLQREQFGKRLAGFQLVQEQLARIAGNAAASLAMLAQVARVQETEDFDMLHAALAKATTTRLARESAACGRDLLGGNGILTENEVSKLMADVEVLYTYEGTYEINSLIVGRAITGVGAFR